MGTASMKSFPSSPTNNAEKTRAMNLTHLYVVYINIFLYCTCFMMQQPTLPYLSEKLGASTAQFAKMQTLFSIAQSIGSLLSGPALDWLGSRTLLLMSFAASVVCYSLTASATSFTVLYLSRLPTLFQHSVLAARTLVSTQTDDADRAKHLGYVGMCIGLGMTSGPYIGGLLSEVSLQFTSWIATLISLFSFFMIWQALPSDSPSNGGKSRRGIAKGEFMEPSVDGQDKVKTNMEASSNFSLHLFLNVLKCPGVWDLMTIKLITNVASSLFQSNLTLICKEQGFGPKDTGITMSMVGIISVVSQALLVGPAISKFGEGGAVYWSLLGLIVGFSLLATAKGFALILLSIVPQCVAGVLIAAASTSMLTKSIPKSLSGTALAMDMGLWSCVRMVTPGMGTWILTSFGPPGIGAASMLLIAALMGSVHMKLVNCNFRSEPYRQK